MEENNQNQVNKRKNKILAVCLILLICVIGGLVAGIILINHGGQIGGGNNDNNDSSSEENSYTPTLASSEIIYNTLEDYYEAGKADLNAVAMEYCTEQIAEKASDSFGVIKPCVQFMLDHNYAEEAIKLLDWFNQNNAPAAELLTVYSDYSVAYDSLGNVNKSNEYYNKYLELKNSQPGGL